MPGEPLRSPPWKPDVEKDCKWARYELWNECLVYIGVCTELDDGLARVRNEVDPITYKIDNDVAVCNNILDGINATLADPNAVIVTAQGAFYVVAQPFLDAVNLLNTALSGTAAAASCVADAANQIVAAAVNAALGYVSCVTPVLSLIPGQLTQIQGIVTRRSDPTIVNIGTSLVGIVQQFLGLLTGLVDAINDAINSVISLITAIAADLMVIFGQVIQTALSIVTCAINVKLGEIQAAVNIVTGIVTCATNLGVPVTPPVLPPAPEDVSVIVNKALATFATFANVIASLANAIANAAYAVKVIADQIAAVTATVIQNAISSAVQVFIDKLNALKLIYSLNPAVIAEIQSGIDNIVIIKNNCITSAIQLFVQLGQQASSLQQNCADLDDGLKQVVRKKGNSAIIACINNIAHNNPNYVKVCTNTVLKNFPLETGKIQGNLDVVNAGKDDLDVVNKGALKGQSAIAGSKANDEYNKVKNNLKTKYNIVVS